MSNDSKIYSNFLTSLFREGFKKMDKLATVNVLIIFALAMFALLYSVSESLLNVIYEIVKLITGAMSNRVITTPGLDSTPFWIYGLFLFGGLSLCMFIVHVNNKGRLW